MDYVQVIDGSSFASIYIVGDLHGSYQLLMNHLNSINFNFDEDLLICTGDLVDRGKENLECISLLKKPWFKTVRGNHEELFIKGLYDLKLRQLHERNGGEWFYQLQSHQQLEIIKIFEVLPLVIELQLQEKRVGIAHADIDIHNWNAFKQDVEKGDYSIPGITSAYQNVLWGRGRIKNLSKDYEVVEGIDAIYLGHTIVKEMTQIDNCFYIDVGSSFTNKLCIVKIK
ncbi:metallophosphoesterase [Acinetobacter johnsonii]|uniref:metallophosphoesterase n=1 Tax=Acinetobacter johnsonii TaxID=40214 RepID=UPI00398559A9